MVKIIDFVQQNSKAAARWNKEHQSLDQEVRHIQLPVLVLVTCHGAAKQPTASSTSYYSALLLYGRNFVILHLPNFQTIYSSHIVNAAEVKLTTCMGHSEY